MGVFNTGLNRSCGALCNFFSTIHFCTFCKWHTKDYKMKSDQIKQDLFKPMLKTPL